MLALTEGISVPVQVFPAGLTGKDYRKSIGLPAYPKVYAERSWRICHKFKCIKKHNRLAFLRKYVKVTKTERSFGELANYRNGFDKWKSKEFPMSESCPCYVCTGTASIRHHVVPLSQGGRNKRNNIVPLCGNCHAKIHPHLNKPKISRTKLPVIPAPSVLSSYGAVASWNSVQPKINGPLAVKQEPQVVNLVAVGA